MVFFSLSVNAQRKGAKKPAVTKDNYKQMFTDANEMAGENFTDSALHTFILLYKYDTTNANLAYFVGDLYLKTQTHKAEALPYLEKAALHVTSRYRPDDPYEKDAPPPAYYDLARAQHLNYQFDQAIDNFTKFRKLLPKKDDRQIDIDYWIMCCNNGKMLMKTPVACKIVNIGDSVNSIYPDYCPVLTADEQELYFTSRRPIPSDSTKDIEGYYYEDVWYSHAKPDGSWSSAINIGAPVNTAGNDATVSISPDGQTMFVYKDNTEGDGNIFATYKSGNQWSYPTFIDSANSGVINSSAHEPSASETPDGQTLYFVSDRPGGLGGTDIYRVSIQDNGAWGSPTNLGPTINTKYDEEAPYIHSDDSTMFFSSKGHNTMGGYDVFITHLNNKGGFSEPQNMGYPINTPDDDIYFRLSGDGKRGYYTSIRPGGYGEKDIYEVLFTNPLPVEPVAVLVGYIKSPDGGPLTSTVLVSTTASGSTVASKVRVNPKTGKFLQVLRPNTNYDVKIISNGQTVSNQPFYLPADSSYTHLSRSFFRTSIILGDTTNVFKPKKKQNAVAANTKGNMAGQFLDDKEAPLPMLRIQLVNDKDSVIATTITDKSGHFTFNQLPKDGKYMLKADLNDPKLNGYKHIYLADTTGKIVRDYDLKKKKDAYYKDVPVDLASLSPLAMNDKAAKYSKDTANMPKSDADFTRYFAYNIKKINENDPDFAAFIDKVANKLASGPVSLNVSGSASKVPTSLFSRSNKTLAHYRALDAQTLIKNALKAKKIDTSKLTFMLDHTIQGPAYDHDAADQVKYEKFQYVKVYIH